ncbi:MAG: 3-hydroxyacyl-ACP dehydratase FabZ [Candidatus Nitrospinota bacterium M3_3B_026]
MDIYGAIPHRPPFLFVDKVTEAGEKKIRAEKVFGADLEFFKGHYPHFPVAPGALILESIFQAGAILVSGMAPDPGRGVPVVARIKDAKFRKMVRPGDVLEIEVELEDTLGSAFYMKGRARVDGELAASVSFTCALALVGED